MKRIMKTAGWIFIVIGALAFLGAASKGNSVFGPLFWIGIGGVLLYLKREREGFSSFGKEGIYKTNRKRNEHGYRTIRENNIRYF